MDLNLYLGFPRSGRHLRSVDLGSDLALGSPFPAAFSREEEFGDSPSAMPRNSEPQGGNSHAPYSPSRAAIIPASERSTETDHPPPFVIRSGDDPGQGYSPYCPVYQLLASPSYAPAFPPAFLSSRAADSPYSLSYVPTHPADLDSLQVLSGNGDRASRLLSSYGSPSTDPGLGEEPLVVAEGGGGGSSHARYSPSYIPLRAIPEEHDDVAFAPYQPIVVGSGDLFEGDEGSSLQPELLEPEVRFRRLIELQRRSHGHRQYEFSHPYGIDESFDESAERSGKNKTGEKGSSEENSEEKKKKDARGVDFECNICLELAEEPVVTSCGHLFCWPCLYQWLHLHSSHKECPVCKGEVIEATITPVYGRGNSEHKTQRGQREEDSGLKVPPRPHGRRVESWRQRIRRPVSRRLTMGLSSAWRRVLGEDIPLGEVEASLQETINSAHRRVATRLRASRPARTEVGVEGETLGIIHPLPQRNSSLSRQIEESNSLVVGRLSSTPVFSLGGSHFSRILETFSAEGAGGGGRHSGNPQSADELGERRPAQQGTDQASASSTMAVIQGPNSAGSSRPLRNRGRSSSGSLDADECPQQGRKRRRTS